MMANQSHIRAVDSTRRPGWARRAYCAFATTRLALFISRNVSWKLDPVLLRLTRGRLASTLMVPSGILETRGARTGATRHNAVIYWSHGAHVVIAASQAGSPRNPSWYYNLLAHPEVTFAGLPMQAEVVSDSDRDRLWTLGDRVFPAFPTFRRRAEAAGRTIPLIQLTPR